MGEANAPVAPAAGRGEGFLGLNEEEEKFWKETAARVVVTTIVHPLSAVKTLMQLGHEPFPLSTGQTLIVAGRNAYFLPNAFVYAKLLVKSSPQGIPVLFTGLESAALSVIVGRYVARAVNRYMDEFYPDMGGKAEFEGVDELDLSDHESARRALRAAIRDSIVRIVAVYATRPFVVVCIRQIAQLIGGEVKYTHLYASLRTIGTEEGPSGFFSGVIPQLLGELVTVWGVHSLTYLAERGLYRAGLDRSTEQGQKDIKETRRLSQLIIPHIVSTFSYSYSVISTVMAVAGSGLAVSFLPYSPSFAHWREASDYLASTGGLKRGARLFLREQVGAVSVGEDRQLYAATKHFA